MTASLDGTGLLHDAGLLDDAGLVDETDSPRDTGDRAPFLVAGGCCAPVLGTALDAGQAEDLAAAFKVLADPVRLRLFSLVATADGGEACVCDLVAAVDRAQGTVSHHLGLLVTSGLLRREKRGRWSWYAVVPGRLQVLRDALAPTGAG